ncbi:hypothetical protein GCU67_03590 [Modestobacter muralis]|uniref:Uncharacterized protein n=1 Tax=Modestobacter muralis TaxID=1608614 RepID=A0A6P0ETG3_9ACTN|nr:hypothetical protein [Modestobacter muralis]NEK93264.1 hypothetical protein [Modestobacter muralis]NEN50031.1 hypothetical protein [Modestobacter muralis]
MSHARPFGLHRTWAVCRCGHRSRLVEGQDPAANEAAIELLVTEHGARRDPQAAHADYEGGGGPFRPRPPAP